MKRSLARFIVAVLVGIAAILPANAVTPDEVLDDPALEARARSISAELRCLVCQNQSIDDSDASLAADLRVLVRDRLKAGDTDEEVIAFVVARYGEFVLLKPSFSVQNALLWLAPFMILVIGGVVLIVSLRNRNRAGIAALSEAEQTELENILQARDSEH